MCGMTEAAQDAFFDARRGAARLTICVTTERGGARTGRAEERGLATSLMIVLSSGRMVIPPGMSEDASLPIGDAMGSRSESGRMPVGRRPSSWRLCPVY